MVVYHFPPLWVFRPLRRGSPSSRLVSKAINSGFMTPVHRCNRYDIARTNSREQRRVTHCVKAGKKLRLLIPERRPESSTRVFEQANCTTAFSCKVLRIRPVGVKRCLSILAVFGRQPLCLGAFSTKPIFRGTTSPQPIKTCSTTGEDVWKGRAGATFG